MKKLSRKAAHRLALHYAISERLSFADCQHRDDPGFQRAVLMANEFRRVLKEEFGEMTWEDEFAAANYPSVDIHDIASKEPTTPTDVTPA